MNARDFQAHRTQLCNVPGCDCSCPNCRIPPLPTFGIQRSTRGAPPPHDFGEQIADQSALGKRIAEGNPPSRLAEFLTSGAVLLFVVVAFGLLLWALT